MNSSFPSPSLISGVVPLFKPKGMTSRQACQPLQKLFPKVRMGHAGTLDPLAEGLLPVLLGGATRLQDVYVKSGVKEYEAVLALGFETSTLDEEGDVVKRVEVGDDLCLEDIIVTASGFVGEQKQTPPLYSAVKHKGRALYEYARKQQQLKVEEIKTLERFVEIFSLEVLEFNKKQAQLTFRVRCSSGTYVRSLGRDLAQALGTCGTLLNIKRTETAGFTLIQAVTWEDLSSVANMSAGGFFQKPSWVIPIAETRLPGVGRVHLGLGDLEALFQGKDVEIFLEAVVEKDGAPLTFAVALAKASPSSFFSVLLLDPSGNAVGLATGQVCPSRGRARLHLQRNLL